MLQILAKFLRQRELNVLLGRGDGSNVAIAALGKVLQNLVNQDLRHRCTGRNSNGVNSFKPLVVDLASEVNSVGRLRARLQRNLNQTNGVRGVCRTDNNHEVARGANLLDGNLAVLGGVANVIRWRVLQRWNLYAQLLHCLHGFVNTQGGLAQPHNLARVAHHCLAGVLRAIDDLNPIRRLTRGSLNLFVASVAHQDDVVVFLGEALNLAVNLGHQRAGCIDGLQVPSLSGGNHRRRNTVRGEHQDGTFRNLVHLVNEDGAAGFQRRNHKLVVHNLLAHVDRRTVVIQSLFNRNHSTVNASAVAAWAGQKHLLVAACGGLVGSRGLGKVSVVGDRLSGIHSPIIGERLAMSDLGSWGAEAPASKSSSQDQPWPVSRLSQTLKDYIDRLGFLWIEGEITKVSFTNSMFATLRDLTQEASVEIHAWNLGKIDSTIKHGDRVVALVKPVFWPKNGKLTMQVYEMRKVGLGELLERIERLRAQLAAEGLTQNKQPLPFLPNLIGLVTGKDSDAEKDVLQNAKLRWPEVRFRVIHSLVQGDKAAPELVRAIQTLDADPEVDVIIVARGGGSFLDLLSFSDEAVVRAAAATSKPLVSAIGHENDRPVLDDVADLRASTPTDAAKRVVPDVVEERRQINQLLQRASVQVNNRVQSGLDFVAQVRSRPILANPYAFLEQRALETDTARGRARNAFGNLLVLEARTLEHLRQQVTALSPQKTLDRGYSVVRNLDGTVITGPAQAPAGTGLRVRLAQGEISATAN